MDMLGSASASLVHAGLGSGGLGCGPTPADLTGLEGLVATASATDPFNTIHHHHHGVGFCAHNLAP